MLWKQYWVWKDRGWDDQEDGYSVHLTQLDRNEFIKEYWDMMPDATPDEYSCPSGNPYQINESDLSFTALKELKNSRNGMRVYV